MPQASTPTTRRTRVGEAASIPTSVAMSCVGRPVTGVRRASGYCASIRTSARLHCWRETIWRAMCSASVSTRNASPITTSSIASPNNSGNRDMWTPFCCGSGSTVRDRGGEDLLAALVADLIASDAGHPGPGQPIWISGATLEVDLGSRYVPLRRTAVQELQNAHRPGRWNLADIGRRGGADDAAACLEERKTATATTAIAIAATLSW
jgi:hypothetical protein